MLRTHAPLLERVMCQMQSSQSNLPTRDSNRRVVLEENIAPEKVALLLVYPYNHLLLRKYIAPTIHAMFMDNG